MAVNLGFKDVGKECGITIWGFVDQNVKRWPRTHYNYATFYCTDCFLILHSAQTDESKRTYTLFIWIGNKTSKHQQQIGIKRLNELQRLLHSKCVQYREVQGNETKAFLDLWPKIEIKNCSKKDEFKYVNRESYEPQLLHIVGYKKHVQVYQVPLSAESLNSCGTFVLDLGLTIFQFYGNKASAWYKRKANAIVDEIQASRYGKVRQTYIIDGILDVGSCLIDIFWAYFGGNPGNIKDFDAETKTEHTVEYTKLLSLSCMISSSQFGQVCVNQIDKSKLESGSIYVLNCIGGEYVYVWIGRNVAIDESNYSFPDGISIGMRYLQQMDKINVLVDGWIRQTSVTVIPLDIIELCFQYIFCKGRGANIPICVVWEGYEPLQFWLALNCEIVGGRALMKHQWSGGRRRRWSLGRKND